MAMIAYTQTNQLSLYKNINTNRLGNSSFLTLLIGIEECILIYFILN